VGSTAHSRSSREWVTQTSMNVAEKLAPKPKLLSAMSFSFGTGGQASQPGAVLGRTKSIDWSCASSGLSNQSRSLDRSKSGRLSAVSKLPHEWPANMSIQSELNSVVESVEAWDTLLLRHGDNFFNDGDFGEFDRKKDWCFYLWSFTIEPMHPLRILLDLGMLIFLMYDLVAVPYMLAWDESPEGVLKYFSTTASVFWVIDLIGSFKSCYWYKGDLEKRQSAIIRNYLHTWFLPDFTLVCLDWTDIVLSLTSSNSGDSGQLSFLRIAKLLKSARLFRLARLIQVASRMSDRSVSDKLDQVITCVELLFAILWSSHVLACCWYAVGNSAPSDTGQQWLDLLHGPDGKARAEEERAYQYFAALHWGLSIINLSSMDV